MPSNIKRGEQMTEVQELELSHQHQIVWNTLRTLKDGDRMVGADLREVAGIKDERTFYKIIEDLRTAGMFIGASRTYGKGYFEIRTAKDMESFLRSKRQELQGEWEALDELEKKWMKQNI